MELSEKLREKWENFNYWLEEHNIPKPVFFIAIAIVAILLVFMILQFTGVLGPEVTVKLRVRVVDRQEQPIEDATVTLWSDFFEAMEKTTDARGEAVFDVPANRDFILEVTYGDASESVELKLEEDTTERVQLDVELVTYFDKRVIFYKDDTEEKATEVSDFYAYCTLADWETRGTASDGEALLRNIPSNCGSLRIQVADKDYVTATIDSSPFTIKLAEEAERGTVVAVIKDSETMQAVGANEVSAVLLNEFLQQIAGPVASDASGTVTFENVEPGRYCVKVLGLGKYKDVMSEYKQLRDSEQLIFNVNIEKSAAFPIKVRVVDVHGIGIKSVKLELKDLTNNTLVQSRWTDEKGEYTFYVDQETSYNLIVTKGKWVKTIEVTPSEEFIEVTYNPEELKEAGTVIVTITDQEKNPLENVNVEILTPEHKATGYACSTGADGKCEFENVMPGIYYVKATLGNFPPVASGNFEIKPYSMQPEKILLKMDIPKGIFEFTVYNSSAEPISGAHIKAVDIGSNKIVAEASTDSEGVATLTVRVDTKPYFIVEASGYMPYVTVPLTPVFGVTLTKEITLISDASSLKVQFDGLYSNDDTVQDSLSAGASYKARFKLIVPSTRYKAAGLHIRTGNDQAGKTNLMEEDIAYISGLSSAATKVLKGTTFSPPTGTKADLSSAAQDAAKWVELEWNLTRAPLPKKGVFEAEVEITVQSGVADGELLKLSYRGYGYAEIVDRDPKDTQLGNAKDTTEKHGLYASTYDVVYSIGITNLCDGSYCKSFSIEDVQKNMKLAVIESYPAKIAGSYRLHFLINKQASGTASNVTLSILDEQHALKFGEYAIVTPDGTKHEGVAENELSINIGAFAQHTTISGFVNFETVKEGKALLKVVIAGERGSLFEQVITIEIEPGKELALDIVPKTIVAMVDNELLFRFTEQDTGNAVEGVSVSLYLNDQPIGSGITDYDGVFPYKLQAPSSGAVLKIIGKKPGYKLFKYEIKIDADVLKITPPSIDLDMQAEFREEAEFALTIENQTAISLTLKEISYDGLNELIEIEGAEAYYNKEIKPSESIEITLKAKLTKKGKAVEATTQLPATLNVTVENSELAKQWASSIVLNARILLGGELDDTSCLTIEPASWSIRSFGEAKKMAFTIRNNCTVSSEPVSLRYLKARVRWHGESPIGMFAVSGDIVEGRIELKESRTMLIEELKKNSESELIIMFTPSEELQSASVEPTIEFEAEHFSDSGREVVKAHINVEIKANNLMKCLRVIRQEPMELKTCGFDTGWGLSTRYFDRDPYAITQQQFTWPTVQYVPPWQTGYSYGPYNSKWECEEEKAELIIENSCTEDVEITIRTDSALSAEPSTLTVSAVSSKSVEIAPSARMGRFKVKVLARFVGATKLADEIDNFTIKVVRYEEISTECLPVIEPKVLRANFLGWQKTVAYIYNKCYHLGYALSQPTLENFHCYTPASEGTSLEGPCPLIKNVIVGRSRVEEVSETEAWEIMEINIWYNPRIIEQAPLSLEGSLEQQIGKLRIIATNYYTAIISPGVISVPMYVPDVGLKYFPTDVTFEDPFQWLGIAGSLIDKGSPDLQPAECINSDALNLPAHGNEYQVIADGYFDNDLFVWNENPPQEQWVMPIARSNEDLAGAEQGFCGRDDYISNVGFESWEDPNSGVKLYFELTKNKHHIVMTVDRSSMFTKCARIDFYLPIKVTRRYYNAGTQDAKLHVVVNVLNKGVTQLTAGCENEPAKASVVPAWFPTESCDSTQQYEEYGFDRLLFTWRPEQIGPNACDPEVDGYFCDGAQFIMQLSHRLKTIKEDIVDELNNLAINSQQYQQVLAYIAQNSELVNEINEHTGKLYKLAKKQTIVMDNVQNKALLFFLSEQGPVPTVLEPETSCDISVLQNSLLNLASSYGAADETTTITALRSALVNFKNKLYECYGNDVSAENVIGLISGNMDNAQGDALMIWNAFKSVAEYNDDLQTYVITYNEYESLHEQLLSGVATNIAIQDRTQPITVNIGTTSLSATEDAWVAFLQALITNTRFEIGLINKPGLSAQTEEYIRRNAASFIEGLPDIDTTELSYAYLKADNLSESLVHDVLEVYEPVSINPDQFEFKRYESEEFTREIQQRAGSCRVASGKYAYRIEPKLVVDFRGAAPTIALEKFVVKLALTESLAEIDRELNTKYAENPLLYMSFDGSAGKNSKQADYGIGLSVPEYVDIYAYYRSHDDWEKLYSRAPGIKTMKLKYGEKFEKSRTGTVLKINLRSGTLEYVPSYPVLLYIISSQQQGNNVIYYKLSNDYYYGNINELFVWLLPTETGDETAEVEIAEARVDELAEHSPESFCQGWSSVAKAAKLIVGPGEWYTVTYVPVSRSGTTDYLQLEILCAKDPITLNATLFTGDEYTTAQTTGPEGGSVRLVEPTGVPPSIEEYVEMIKTGEICIDRINNLQLVLKWNPEAIWWQ
jgi:hypothetical protein